MRLSTLQSFKALALVTGIAVAGLLGGCAETGEDEADGAAGSGGSGGSGSGITCNCTGSGPSPGTQNRLHIGNFNNQAGISVEMTAGGQVCTIAELIVTPAGAGIELDQCLMDADVGDSVAIVSSTGGTATCVVDETANVPGIDTPQTFASVSTQPASVTCDTGFEFPF